MAIVKNDGNSNNGIAYPDNIPYSVVIYLFEYPMARRVVVKRIGSRK